MAVHPVVRLPHPVLKKRAQWIGAIDDDARDLANDLVETMRASPACVGLAATQIGVERHALVIDVTGHPKAESCNGLLVLFDAEVVSSSGAVVGREGCMSVPDLTGDVTRAAEVTVRAKTPDGEQTIVTANAFEARALLHEIDHLDGKLFLDRVDSHRGLFKRKTYR